MSRELFLLGALAPLAVVAVTGQPLDGSGGRTQEAHGIGALTNRDVAWLGATAFLGIGLLARGPIGERALSAGLGLAAGAATMKAIAVSRGEPLLPQA